MNEPNWLSESNGFKRMGKANLSKAKWMGKANLSEADSLIHWASKLVKRWLRHWLSEANDDLNLSPRWLELGQDLVMI